MSYSIPVVPDIPSDDPQYGFEDYAESLAEAIRGVDPPQLTIGIYGPWGSGKSSLLRAIAHSLGRTDEVIVVPFDAWRYEEGYSGHPVEVQANYR
jgi:predicted KAP-like P-loop ATPase